MNWKLISLISLGFGSMVAGMISAAADRHMANAVDEMAIDQRDAGVEEDIAWAKDNIRKADEITARERKEVFEGVRSWKRANRYDEQMGEIHCTYLTGLREYKDSIDYDSRRQEIEDEFEDSLDAFKESIDYDYEIDLANAEIKDAESLYKKRCNKIDIVSGSDDEISDALKDIKKSEKEKMNETIKEAKDKISALKNKVSVEEVKLNRKKQAAIRELEQELNGRKNVLQKEENESMKVLTTECEKVTNELRDSVTKKRSEEDQKILDRLDESHTIIDSQTRKDAELAKELYENATESEKWAGYFKANGVPKFFIAIVGTLPLIPAGFIIWKYTKFVYNVVTAM